MPLIEREKKETFRTIPIKLEEGLAERFLAYAEFLESSKDHVVSAALTYIIGHDKDFTAHLTANGALPGKPGRPRKTGSEANGKAGAIEVNDENHSCNTSMGDALPSQCRCRLEST